MGKVLDLRPFVSETFEILLADGKLHLRKPTEMLLVRMMNQIAFLFPSADGENDADTSSNEETIRQIEAINTLVTDILNNNTDDRVITNDWVTNGLPLGAKLAIIQAYADFAMEIKNDPN